MLFHAQLVSLVPPRMPTSEKLSVSPILAIPGGVRSGSKRGYFAWAFIASMSLAEYHVKSLCSGEPEQAENAHEKGIRDAARLATLVRKIDLPLVYPSTDSFVDPFSLDSVFESLEYIYLSRELLGPLPLCYQRHHQILRGLD